jgi:mannose-6-phosphate isomerase-like protein (cupin superfamily)
LTGPTDEPSGGGRAADDPLAGRVARFAELEPSSALFIDTVLPGYARTIWSIVGQNVGESRDTRPAIPPDGFHLAVIESEPGNGSALHTHTTVEVFMPLSGRWSLFYGDTGERDVVLEQWDVCSVPAGVWRGFRNAGEVPAHLLVLVGGTDAGRLTWAPEIVERARQHGMTLDGHGYMTGPGAAAS